MKGELMVFVNLDLDNPLVIKLIKKMLELKFTSTEERFTRLNEAQRISQQFLRETEFTI